MNKQESPGQDVCEGFDGLELVVDDLESPQDDSDIPVAALTTGRYNLFSLARSDSGIQKDALDYFGELLGYAGSYKNGNDSAAGKIVVIRSNSVVIPEQPPVESYQRSFNLVLKSLEILTRTAEEVRVYLTLENPADQLFLSPLELRDLLNEINNPYMGLAFNPSHVGQPGLAMDWLGILRRHCMAMRVPMGDLTWVEVVGEFSRYSPTRPVIYY